MEAQRTLLKLYTDVHIDKAVARELLRRGVDIVRCQDVGMHNAKDNEHLEYAAREGRVVVTSDDDFIALHWEWQTAGQPHAGIFFIEPELTNQGDAGIGPTVTVLLFWHEAIEGGAASVEKDVYNQLRYLP